MIQSLIDSDLYKFTTSYAYKTLFPLAEGTFKFQDRNKQEYTDEEFKELKSKLFELANAGMSSSQFEWVVANIPYIAKDYWEWLRDSFKFDPMKIDCYLDDNRNLHIEVTDLLYKATLYEVPILAIVSEYNFSKEICDFSATMEKLNDKIQFANDYHLLLSDFSLFREGHILQENHFLQFFL